MFAKTSPASKTLSLADLALIKAAEEFDLDGLNKALAEGGRVTVRKPYRGLTGEPLTLMAVRRGQPALLDALLNAGAPLDDGLAMAAALLTERATRVGEQDPLQKAQAVVERLESMGVDWGVSDRSIGAGLRAIDLLAAAQPHWAMAPSQRQGLEPMGHTVTSFTHQPSGRARR